MVGLPSVLRDLSGPVPRGGNWNIPYRQAALGFTEGPGCFDDARGEGGSALAGRQPQGEPVSRGPKRDAAPVLLALVSRNLALSHNRSSRNGGVAQSVTFLQRPGLGPLEPARRALRLRPRGEGPECGRRGQGAGVSHGPVLGSLCVPFPVRLLPSSQAQAPPPPCRDVVLRDPGCWTVLVCRGCEGCDSCTGSSWPSELRGHPSDRASLPARAHLGKDAHTLLTLVRRGLLRRQVFSAQPLPPLGPLAAAPFPLAGGSGFPPEPREPALHPQGRPGPPAWPPVPGAALRPACPLTCRPEVWPWGSRASVRAEDRG